VFTELHTQGNVYVAFADVRDANKAIKEANDSGFMWTIRRLKPTDFVVKLKPEFARYASGFEGQVTVTIYTPLKEARAHQQSTGPKVVKTILEMYGDLKAFRTLIHGGPENGLSEYRVEFYNTYAAEVAVNSLDTKPFGVSVNVPIRNSG
jgi:hypothetical protein